MNPSPVSRRAFVRTTALTAAALPLVNALRGADAATPAGSTSATPSASAASADGRTAALRWIDDRAPAALFGNTVGVPWPRGQYAKDTTFVLHGPDGTGIATQSWPLAYWPDGSLKFTAHAIGPDAAGIASFTVAPGQPAAAAKTIRVTDTDDAVTVDTGVIQARLPKRGRILITEVLRDGKPILRDGHLVALSDDAPAESSPPAQTHGAESDITKVTVEQSGPIRAVVKIDGVHSALVAPANAAPGAATGKRRWLPFSVRVYFHAGSEALRVMHSFVFDGDENKDFLRGLGVRFAVPLRDELHNRHVRFAGEGHGLWAEAVRGLTGLRRDPDARPGVRNPGGGPQDRARNAPVKDAQLAGQATPEVSTFNGEVRERLQYIPAWGDFTLSQLNANGFTLRKRTKAGHGWIEVDQGRRAAGVGYIGGADGGVVFGLRDFWQRHPTQLDVRNAHTDSATVTVWLHSPEAPAMDLRFYHDGMGMDTYEKQYDGGLEITYEDYEAGYGSAHGIARSSEITLWAVGATPARERIVQLADAVRTPPQLAASPAHILKAGVFGAMWTLPDRSTPARAAIEDRLDFQFAYYQKQVDQRHWYGFWHYGDVMHTYDGDRHVWRYDIGGFAWDNSELSPDLWLWYAFVRSGRADLFRFAEAMTRHTGEVDVYHTGRFAGLGTRHNVQHWGCSAKQVRISTAAYRRIYYFLTGDERVGDLMRELLDVDLKLDAVDPARKLKNAPAKGEFTARVSFGTDWANLAVAWLTEWERGGDAKYRDKLLRGMRDFGAAPQGFFTSERYGYDAASGSITVLPRAAGERLGVSHLDSVFGAVETFAELIQLTDGQPEYAGFAKAWIQYCELYNAPAEAQTAALGKRLNGNGLNQAHSRLTAYAAWKKKDDALAARAWKEFSNQAFSRRQTLTTNPITGPTVLNPVDEAMWVSTNDSSQWGLAAMQCLALVGEKMP